MGLAAVLSFVKYVGLSSFMLIKTPFRNQSLCLFCRGHQGVELRVCIIKGGARKIRQNYPGCDRLFILAVNFSFVFNHVNISSFATMIPLSNILRVVALYWTYSRVFFNQVVTLKCLYFNYLKANLGVGTILRWLWNLLL